MLLLVLLFGSYTALHAQPGVLRDLGQRQIGTGSGSGDSLKRRNKFEDSLTITYHLFDSVNTRAAIDSSVNDFSRRFPIPPDYHFLGNPGNAAKSIVYRTEGRPGWDPGFHAFDIYRIKLEDVRFYNTTRPYTELGYTIGSQTQQFIEILHTQNIRPHWNASLRYRLINSPGFFKNQATNHNNYLFSSWYQSPNRRYNNYVVLLGNKLQSAENGGIRTDKNYLDDPVYTDRFGIPTRLGLNGEFSRNFFSVDLRTGNRYRDFNGILRQQYDLGRKDSLVTDSTVIPLFYPRLRFEHTFKWGRYRYQFRDYDTDSAFYQDHLNITLLPADTLDLRDRWVEWSNDFSIYQYPDARNLHQFIKAGIEYQLLTGELKNGKDRFYNFMGHGEYRNRSRNQKWDIGAFGKLWLNGYNAGDYHAYISLQRLISTTIGSLQAGFENINRSPSFLFDARSSFYLDAAQSFSKENTVHLFAKAFNPALRLQLGADYYLITNYLYLRDYYKPNQESSPFNILKVHAGKTFRLRRHLNLYSEVTVQQKTGTAEINLPLFFTRNRLVFEGNFYRNLNFAGGFEIRYHTPYKADGYSPVQGMFSYQDTLRIVNRPDVHAFVHFRIRSFRAFVRFENLNTVRIENGLEFKEHNFAAPAYPYPGLVFRLGIYWGFVN